MSAPALTRRQAVAGIGMATAAAAVPGAALASVGGDSAAWDTAMAELKAADDHYSRIAKAYDSASERYEALCPSLDSINADVQRYASPAQAIDRQFICHSFDVSEARANMERGAGKWWWTHDIEASKAEHHARLDRIEAFKAQCAAIDTATRRSALGDECDLACDACGDATSKLLAMPAPHAKALLWKLEYLMVDTAYTDDSIAPTVADMRRLLGS